VTRKRIFALIDPHWDVDGVGPLSHGRQTLAWLVREGLATFNGAKLTDKGRAARAQQLRHGNNPSGGVARGANKGSAEAPSPAPAPPCSPGDSAIPADGDETP